MRYIALSALLFIGCMSDEAREARRAEHAKSANEDNRRYWEWVERTLECDWSERINACLCVFHHESGLATTATSEMGVAISSASKESCKKVK